MYVPWPTHTSQRTICGSRFSTSTTWFLGIKNWSYQAWWQLPLPAELCPGPVVSFDGVVGSGFANDDEVVGIHENTMLVVDGVNVGGDGDAVGTSQGL